jgi:hypothetical protein
MRLMRGASVESGVVRVLFGVASKGRSQKVEVRSGRLIRGTTPASSRSKATPTSTAADRSVRATGSLDFARDHGCGLERPQNAVTYKRLGERAEAAFLAKVAGLGFGVAKPWGDSDRYDFIVDAGGRLWRVQVKSAHRVGADGGYSLRLFGHSVGAYREDEIDVLICYLAPEDAWYVFPPEVFRGRRSVKLFGGSVRRRSKFEAYREGWAVLESKSKSKAFTTELHRGRTEVH